MVTLCEARGAELAGAQQLWVMRRGRGGSRAWPGGPGPGVSEPHPLRTWGAGLAPTNGKGQSLRTGREGERPGHGETIF